MINRHLTFKIPHVLTAISGLLILSSISYIIILSTAFSQEPDTLAILRTAMRLELTRAKAIAVNNDQYRLLTRNNNDLQHYLEQQGWVWSDQLGGATFYWQNDRNLTLYCSMYSAIYMICDRTP